METMPQTAEMPAVGVVHAPAERRTARLQLPALLPMLRHAGFPIVIALSVVLNTHRLAQNGYANVFYSAGVRSMLMSWHNFFFVASDPAGLITIDKPPLALWLQAASAKVFGFTPMSLLLPEALAGVLAVAALYVILARRLGPLAAFVGSFALAVFPSFVAVSRDNGVDPLLILLMVLACGAAVRACETGRWRWLLTSAVLVGLAFNTKTLAAYLVVPGIAVAFAVCAPGGLPGRLLKLVVSGLVMVLVSFAWIAAVELTPASQRPFIGGSKNNTELGLTFEYNGFGRVEGQQGGPHDVKVLPGARVPTHPTGFRPTPHERKVIAAQAALAKSTFLPNGHFKNPTPFGDAPGFTRLFGKGLGDQSAWVLPFAVFGAIAFALLLIPALRPMPPPQAPRVRRLPSPRRAIARLRGREDVEGATVAAAHERESEQERLRWRRDPRLALLLVLGGWFFVELVVLSLSKGIVHPYYVSALGPGLGAMTGAGTYALVRLRTGPQPWTAVALAALAALTTIVTQFVLLWREQYMLWMGPVLVVACLVALLMLLGPRRLATPAVSLLVGVLLVVPTAYSATTWRVPVEGTFAAAGPKAASGEGGLGVSPRTVAVDNALLRYTLTHGASRSRTLLVVASDTAAPMILEGYSVSSIGGYSGTDPALSGAQLARMVHAHEARYVVLGGVYSTRGGNGATQAVLRSCLQLSWRQWHSPSSYPGGLALFDCAGKERELAAG